MAKKLTPQKIPKEELVNWLASLLFKNYLINLNSQNYEFSKNPKNR